MDQTSRGRSVGATSWRGRACAAATMMTLMTIAGCGGGRSGATTPVAAGGTTLPALLATVPDDAGVVLHVPPGLVELFASVDGAFATDELRGSLREMKAEGGIARVLAAVGEEATAEGGKGAAAVGWRRGESEVVMWGRGSMGVLRVRLDGVALAASLARAERASGTPLPRKTWQGRPYYDLHRSDDARPTWLLGRVTDHELVLMWTGAVDRDLPVLMDDGPPARPFDGERVVATSFPGRGAEAHFGMMFDPRWVADLMAEYGDERGDERPCADAVLGLSSGLPRIHWAWARSAAATEVTMTVALDRATAARLARDVGPIPRWSPDDRQVAFGIGLPLATAIEVMLPWAERIDRIGPACGRPAGVAAPLRMVASMGPVAAIRAASMSIDPRTERGVMVVRPDDLARFWASLRQFGPLRPLPPMIGEHLSLPGMVITSDGESLLIGVGSPADEVALDRAATLPPGPRTLALMTIGEDAVATFAAEESDSDEERAQSRQFMEWVSAMDIEVGVRGDHLIVRTTFRHR